MVVEKLKEENQTLELWLDNKEKLNEEYRKQIDKYKRQYEHSM
jgi:predicted RNase H-like nuclease (RuvC/YqgF family)